MRGRPPLPDGKKRIQYHITVTQNTDSLIQQVMKRLNCSPGEAIDIITTAASRSANFSKTLADIGKLRGDK